MSYIWQTIENHENEHNWDSDNFDTVKERIADAKKETH